MRKFEFMAELSPEDRGWLQGLADALREKETAFFAKLDEASVALTKGMITQEEALERQEKVFAEKQIFTDARNVIEHYVMWLVDAFRAMCLDDYYKILTLTNAREIIDLVKK